MDVGTILRLAGSGLGAVGGVLVALEFFQLPSYITYNPEFENYTITTLPEEADEYTALGRVGGFLVAAGFALLFVGNLVG